MTTQKHTIGTYPTVANVEKGDIVTRIGTTYPENEKYQEWAMVIKILKTKMIVKVSKTENPKEGTTFFHTHFGEKTDVYFGQNAKKGSMAAWTI